MTEEKRRYCVSVIIPDLKRDGVSLGELSEELDFRERNGIVGPNDGFDDRLYFYSTEELSDAEELWNENGFAFTEIYEVQLGVVADGAKDENCDYHSPQIILIEASHYPEIEEVEKALKDDIGALGCDCVYGITPLEDWALEFYDCYKNCPRYKEEKGGYICEQQMREQERD